MQASLALWPNKDFLDKRTKFGMDVLPLEALLDYSENDVKECHFEVSMFGELLKEMLQTRFARGLVRGMAIMEQEVSASWPFSFACLLTSQSSVPLSARVAIVRTAALTHWGIQGVIIGFRQ